MNFNKIFSTAAVAAASLGLIGAANAVVIASDNFNTYTVGTALNGKNGGSGWASAWTAGNSTSATVVQTVAGDSPMSGRAVQFTQPNITNAAQRTLSSTVNDDVWVDFLFQFDSGTMNGNDFLGMWFGSSSGPNMGLKTNCGDTSTTPTCTADLFVRMSGTAGSFTTNITVGQTYHLVGLLEKTGTSTAFNKFSLWVDPTNAELMGLTGVDAVATGLASPTLNSFNTIGFRTAELDNATNNVDKLLVDNLGLQTTAPLNVPEPSSIALAGLALLGASVVTRRKTRL